MEQQHFHAKVNDQFEFEELAAGDLDLVPAGERKFHVLENHRSFQVEWLEADYAAKCFTLKVNGNTYRVELTDPLDQLVEQLGFSTNTEEQIKEITAPMPGLVLDIRVVILEAMKMENVLKSLGTGKVKTILVQKGTPVDKGQLLIEME